MTKSKERSFVSFRSNIMNHPLHPCRISGLTSAKGLKLNGLPASAPPGPFRDANHRVPVHIEGVPGPPLSLKHSNLVFFPSGLFDGGVGVGRGTIRDTIFCATAVDNKRTTIVNRQQITGGAARSRGNLLAAEMQLQAHSRRRQQSRGINSSESSKMGGIVIMCTDLNIALALNRVAAGREAELAGSSAGPFRTVKELIRRQVDNGKAVFANFRPHRIEPDGYDRNKSNSGISLGDARSNSVQKGAFKIYPCAYQEYHDSMEARFIDDTTSEDAIVVRHEIYLDYGPEEAEAYVLNAGALGDIDRLFPSALAKVDPQAFWSAVLHIDVFTKALESLGIGELYEKWDGISKGVKSSRKA